jgi:Cu/Ag efflux pump CusA
MDQLHAHAIPLSIIITAAAFSYFGISINTMTLGGLAVAIGELVMIRSSYREHLSPVEGNHKPQRTIRSR